MLRGNKVELCGISEKNLEQLRKWRNTPELRVYFREHREITYEMQKEWWERSRKDPNQYNFEIWVDGNLIGHCGLYYINWISRKAEFGIYIGNLDYRGRGCGSDALRTLIKYGFNTLNLHKIWCEVYDNNESIKTYRHVGFKDEGILRDNNYDEGRWMNSYILSLLEDEWRENEYKAGEMLIVGDV